MKHEIPKSKDAAQPEPKAPQTCKPTPKTCKPTSKTCKPTSKTCKPTSKTCKPKASQTWQYDLKEKYHGPKAKVTIEQREDRSVWCKVDAPNCRVRGSQLA